MIHRPEKNEVGSDVPMRLCAAVLEDADVSAAAAAAAIASIGLLILTASSSTFGELVEDVPATHTRQ
jgi:hypothetical protein